MSNRQGTSKSDWLMRAALQNPEGLLLLAAGAVLLMRKASPLGRAIGGGRFVRGTDAGTQIATGAADNTFSAADRAREMVGTVASSASDYAVNATRNAIDGSDRVMRGARVTYKRTIEGVLRDKPLLVPLAGVAAGALVAAALPSSDFEKQMMAPIGAQVTEAGSNAGEQLKEAVGKAGETLKHAVDQRELNPEGLKTVATEVAVAFSSSMMGESTEATSGGESSGHDADHPGGG